MKFSLATAKCCGGGSNQTSVPDEWTLSYCRLGPLFQGDLDIMYLLYF